MVGVMIFAMVGVNSVAALDLFFAVRSGYRMEAELEGKIAVDGRFIQAVKNIELTTGWTYYWAEETLEPWYSWQADILVRTHAGTKEAIEKRLRYAVRAHGTRDFVQEWDPTHVLAALPRAGAFPAMLGSIVLLWWCLMMVCQGESLALDLQRRRHPVWEWLFTHPVTSSAVFTAEMLAPIAANPIYCTAPLFVGISYSLVYGMGHGIAAGLTIGIPITVATACLGKALEIGMILRFSPRIRGAIIGIMSLIGYTAMMMFIFAVSSIANMSGAAGRVLEPLTALPWPWLGLFLGQSHGSFSFLTGMFTCWCVAGITMAVAIGFAVWGAQLGLSGSFGRTDSTPAKIKEIRFGKDPLYRKEFLWFIRDHSAVVQAILIPLTLAGFQLFNLRILLSKAHGGWNYLVGAGIIFGTYFLWVLGPKSLSSEGAALWIPLTWPRGMEILLKAKARFWSLISFGIVSLVLLYAAFIFPTESWKILLVGIGWFIFARSMAEKTVTLVSVPSSSGEPERIPRTRQWAVGLGMLTFSIGILTQQWNLAILGIVYSYLTSAAMWQNFRARLPFLYDPWSEKLPPPPTLMHAIVSISILIEGGAVLSAIAIAIWGRENGIAAGVVIFGLSAVMVSLGLSKFLSDRGVSARDIWCWPNSGNSGGQLKPWQCGDGTGTARFLFVLMIGVAGGLILGLFAHGYFAILQHVPSLAEIIQKGQEEMAKLPNLRTSYTICAVGLAPFAEEYLFRGLLFRTLDREWGGWKAVVGSAVFFAIIHPVLSWLPVGLLGVTNALLFKNTRRLAPAVVLHMVYNIVILS